MLHDALSEAALCEEYNGVFGRLPIGKAELLDEAELYRLGDFGGRDSGTYRIMQYTEFIRGKWSGQYGEFAQQAAH